MKRWATLALLAGLIDPWAQAANGDSWPSYAGTDGQHFSPLTQVNVDTVKRLGLEWYFDIPGVVLAASTPLEIDGTLYFASGYSVIRALEARTGKLLWTYDPHVAEVAGEKLRVGWGIRGIAYWNDRILFGTHDGRLIALNAHTGKPVWSVMTTERDDARYITGAPLVFKDRVLIGHAGADVGPVRGYVTAYDAATGAQRWRFYTVPGNPAFGFENDAMRMAAKTWKGEWWRFGGGGTVWNSMTYDAELDRIYIGTGNGAPWNQKIRSPGGGDNLFLCSIVALDANTGRYLWHYQVNPGETWDYVATMDIEMATLEIEGRKRRVLMEAPKNGFFYVIDRDTGKLLSAEKIAKVTWADKIDLASGRPVEAPNARYDKGPFELWPSGGGAHSWQPMAYNPMTRRVYIPVMEMPGFYSDEGIDIQHWQDSPGMVPNIGVRMELAHDVPTDAGSGALLAWDPVLQRAAWKAQLPGIWNGGVTTTAGNLVFQGQADGIFAARDARSGQVLWSFDAQTGIVGAPITYRVDGTQYISILVGYAASGAAAGSLSAQFGWQARTQARRVLTFRLDGKAALPKPRARVPLVAVADPDYAADDATASRGAVVYGNHCFLCHGAGAVAAGSAPDLRTSAAIVNPEPFDTIVRRGGLLRDGMPEFHEITDSEMADLRQFLRSRSSDLRGAAHR